jgi:hypothetical protein
LERIFQENSKNLFRSISKLSCKENENISNELDDLTFRFGPKLFLFADTDRIIGFAATSIEARKLVIEFSKKYQKPVPPDSSGGIFYLIEHDSSHIKCHEVNLPADTKLAPEMFNLHYGDEMEKWHQKFVAKLDEKNHGLVIFEGRPGTGKTFYLRHLMGILKKSHRFYFIPAAQMSVLSRPDFIGFWAEQRRVFHSKKLVVILEDSDAALMTRGIDNREQVSAILNLSDGMFADFLRLQIICTINCSAADIDPALLRPGRLLCHRVFGRLDHAQAVRLAEKLGRKLPTASDYSLAEIFAGDGTNEINRRQRIGFAA